MGIIFPPKQEFLEKSEKGNLIPIYREIIADMDTPVSAFKKLEGHETAFLLESVEGGEKWGRYSFIGVGPFIIFRSKKNNVEIEYPNGNKQSFSDPMPLDRLRELMAIYKPVEDPELPPFSGGAVGYVAFDEIRNFENLKSTKPDELKVPDIYFLITNTLVIFDHLRQRIKIVVNAYISESDTPSKVYDDAVSRINVVHQKLVRPLLPLDNTVSTTRAELDSNFTQAEYEHVVEKCKEYIAAGDVFQVVPSQRFQVPISCDGFEVYRALRSINPSPYMFYLKFRELKLAGSSPEILVRLTGKDVTLRPIAGTRHRGKTTEEDKALEDELLGDPKERAEHLMLVDLGRNDCGRVCEYGSVKVSDFMMIERYSHVMHIVSNVEGKLKEGRDAFDVFKAAFPAGTVSGAPKIRAMQIIDEMEPSHRGTYAGSVGYFGFNGNLDSCITIRTVLIKDDSAYVQAGGGVVADSDPTMEYRETLNKAGAMMRAIETAEYGLDA